MTSRHVSADKLCAFTAATLAIFVFLWGSVQEPVSAQEAPEPPQATATDETPAPSTPPAAEPSDTNEDTKTEQTDEMPAETPKADTPPAPASDDPSPPSEQPAPTGDAPAEETAPKPDADETPEPSEDSPPVEPPASAPQDDPGMPSDSDAPETPVAPALPPKPADADVLDSVIPAPKDSTSNAPDSPDETAPMIPDQVPAEEEVQGPAEVAKDTKSDMTPAPDTAEAAALPSAPSEMDLPPDLEAAMDDFIAEKGPPKLLQFVFRYQPWEKVIQWFADESDLSLIMDSPPPGTFNYTDNRTYTPSEAIDLLNSVLLTKGYTLVRRDRMLMLINLEDGIPPELVETIPLEDLDNRGQFELIAVLFDLDKFDPEEAAKEIEKLIGPQGAVVVLPKTKQLHVTETAGRLRTVRDVIRRVEDPGGLLSGKLESYEFKNILPDEGLMVLRQLLNIPLDGNATEGDTFRFALDPMGMRLLFSGAPDMIAKAREILEAIDVSTGDGETSTALEALQLEVYPIAVADPESVLKVMQTLLEGLPGVRLSTDPKTGSLVALARPSDHATIRATIDQMQSEVRRIEVIYLQYVDPQLAAISIKKMFGDSEEEENTTSPSVEADPTGRQLIVHGTENQIAQIRVLLGKMGETEFADGPVPTGSRIRVLPITGSRAEAALENLRMIWPMISDNPIKEVTPSAIIPSLKRQETIPSRVPAKDGEFQQHQPGSESLPPGGVPGLHQPKPQTQPPESPAPSASEDRQTSHSPSGLFRFAAQSEEEAPADAAAEPAQDATPQAPIAANEETASDTPKAKSPIVISRGPNGIMIASDDIAALDEFERQFNMLTGGMDAERTELNIFYLKYAKATVVAETLTKIIGSGTTGATTADEDSILGQLVGGALGSTMGSLLSLGAATLSPTGMLRITPEPRLNALIVEANATDLRTIEEVLKLLDQPESPEEILVNPRARLIPVYNMAADEVAEIVKVVFADKMQGSSGGNRTSQQGPPSPADFFAAMRGSRGGSSRGGSQRGGNSDSAAKEEPEKMTVGIDARSNSLIVFASQTTYEEVRALVEELDTGAGLADDEEMEVITLKGLNPEAMKAALIAIMGENAVSSSSSSSGRSSSSNRSTSSRSGSSGSPTGGMPDDMRRRIEFMRSMMQRGGPPGGGMMGGRPGGLSAAPGATSGGRSSRGRGAR